MSPRQQKQLQLSSSNSNSDSTSASILSRAAAAVAAAAAAVTHLFHWNIFTHLHFRHSADVVTAAQRLFPDWGPLTAAGSQRPPTIEPPTMIDEYCKCGGAIPKPDVLGFI